MGVLATAYGEINQQRRAMGRRRDHVDRREIAKYRGAFDRRGGRASELCHLSCGGCGALVPPPATDPQRAGTERHDPCPHCGSHAWLDLTEDEVTGSLANVEAYEHKTIDLGRRVRHWVLRIGGAITMGLLCFFAATNSPSGLFALMTTLTGFISVSYFMFGFGHATQVERRALPYRWALPLPPSAEIADEGPTLAGEVDTTEPEPLRAPLSGRPCLGYRVEVHRADAPGRAVAALVAQRCHDLRVEGRSVLSRNVRVDLPTAPVEVTPEQEATATAWLRRLGIREMDGPWVLKEGVLEAGTPVLVSAARRRGAVLTVV